MGIFGFGNKENLYFPGCFTSSLLQNKAENYRKILKKLKIDFKLNKGFLCCGGFLEQAGYEKQFRKIARENLESLKGVKKIITNCPLCCSIFAENYKNAMPDWSINPEFILTTILNKLLENSSVIRSFSSEDIAYYDSCYPGRYLKLCSAPREILKLFGYRLVELSKSEEETMCCGSCGNLLQTNPELSNRIAKDFIARIKKQKIKKIVTADPRAYWHLKENTINEDGLQILEFSDVVCDALGI